LKKKAMKNTDKQILVLGATGKTGHRIVNRLKKLNYHVRLGSRKAEIPFDWENEETWTSVLDGVSSVYISFQPDLAIPGAVEIVEKFTRMAVEKGIKQLVLLSGRGEKEARDCEEIIINSGAARTILRASWFFQNFSESYLLEPILSDHVSLPVSDIGEPFIDAEDIADVAVAALADPSHSQQIYELTGPRLLSFKEAVQEISSALNRKIYFENIPLAEYSAQLKAFEVPSEIVSLMEYLFTHVLDGRNACLGDGVQKVLGREPADFKDYIQKMISSKTWEK